MVSSHYFNDRIDPYMYFVSVLCKPVSIIPTSLSFLKSYRPCAYLHVMIICACVLYLWMLCVYQHVHACIVELSLHGTININGGLVS